MFTSEELAAFSSPAFSYTHLIPSLDPQPLSESIMSPRTSVMDLNTSPSKSGHNETSSASNGQEKKQFRRLNQTKAAGPDGVRNRVLKGCAEQLCGTLHQLFNLSLSQEKVLKLWKTSCLVLVLLFCHKKSISRQAAFHKVRQRAEAAAAVQTL